ncbi:MAG TPA: glycine--tRNA ligase subunit beta [Alphaproteobacteria bacterium]|nr:glycine--tRNA ligase subunit beta [Alphaproteobacteria bacterium]
MPELLLELFSEEIPARMQTRAAEDLKKLVTEKLTAAGLTFTKAEAHVTPRRLALVVDGLPDKQPDVSEEKKGPRVGAPEQAVQGFLKAAGLTSLDQCQKREVGKAEFWFAVTHRPGQATATVLATLLPQAVQALGWPKSMRWAAHRFTWVRPLHSIACVFGGNVVKGSVDLGGGSVAFGDTTHGHRFLAPAPIKVANSEDYKAKLRGAYVVLDAAERRAMIMRDAEKIAALDGLKVKPDQGLLEEVGGLVEFPVVLMGTIDPQFMDLPPEVLTTSMRAHQKYFTVLTAAGELAPRFVVVANMLTEDGGKAIVTGNERVLRARLSDAKFFWDQDHKTKLRDRVPALAQRVFHAKLGTMMEKVDRLQELAADLAEYIPGCDKDRARAAALLCKADLSSGMVGEFPELQGIMGRYYALADGEHPDVADAIRDHYSPLGPNDRCPSAPVSVAAALADKIDSLVGFFAIDEKPTGSKDPFALRRAALGIIRLIVENKLRLPLNAAINTSTEPYRKSIKAQIDPAQVRQDLLDFFADRLKVALREKGVRHDLIDAVFALGGEDDLVRLLARVDALGEFLKSDDGANLLIAYRRASNIVAIEEKKDKTRYDGAVNDAELVQPEEVTLAKALAETQAGIEVLLKREDFAGAMKAMALLRKPVDAFFDKVTVNAPEANLRANRLRLLSRIRATLGAVADFSKIEG